jgi:hypothetical protein
MEPRTRTSSDELVADAPSDAWVPSAAGDQLTGEVVDIDTASSDYRNGYHPLLTVRTDDDAELKLHAFRTVLFNEIVKWQPAIGERIIVTYRGVGKAKAGMNPPHIYRLRVEGRSGTDARDIYRRLRAPEPEPDADPDLPADMPADDPLPF